KQYLDSILILGRRIKDTYPSTRADIHLQNHIVQPILLPQISVRSEKYVLPGRPIPVFVSHKNTDKLYIKVLKYQDLSSNFIQDGTVRHRNLQTQADIDS